MGTFSGSDFDLYTIDGKEFMMCRECGNETETHNYEPTPENDLKCFCCGNIIKKHRKQ
jgi:hypothetical protein